MSTPTARSRDAGAQWDRFFLVTCAIILLVVVTKAQARVLPGGVSTQVGHNSEAWALASVLGAAVVMLRRGGSGAKAHVLAILLSAVALILAGAVYWLDTPTTVKTLNEPLVGAALLILYCALPRPLPRIVPWGLTCALVALMVAGSQLSLVSQQAEALTAILVAPLAFDVVDESVLQPWKKASRWVWLWLFALVLVPVLALRSGDFRTSAGVIPETVDYLARGAEGIWGIAILQFYFLLRRRAHSRDGIDRSHSISPQDQAFRSREVPPVSASDAG